MKRKPSSQGEGDGEGDGERIEATLKFSDRTVPCVIPA